MSNFSFSHSVFKRHILYKHKNQGLFGKGLSRDPQDKNTCDIMMRALVLKVRDKKISKDFLLYIAI